MSRDKFRFPTITAIVIANMVGTGEFTSLGFQLLDIRSGFVILALWVPGGLIAVAGAMTYAGLGVIGSGLIVYWLLRRRGGDAS